MTKRPGTSSGPGAFHPPILGVLTFIFDHLARIRLKVL